MKRAIGFMFAIGGAVLGVLGLVNSAFCIFAIIPIIIGALLVASANRDDKEAKEAERHAEMMAAIKNK